MTKAEELIHLACTHTRLIDAKTLLTQLDIDPTINEDWIETINVLRRMISNISGQMWKLNEEIGERLKRLEHQNARDFDAHLG